MSTSGVPWRRLAALFLVLSVNGAYAAEPANGRQVFETTCAVCHGASGNPDPGDIQTTGRAGFVQECA